VVEGEVLGNLAEEANASAPLITQYFASLGLIVWLFSLRILISSANNSANPE
jgi:hypothetical protein